MKCFNGSVCFSATKIYSKRDFRKTAKCKQGNFKYKNIRKLTDASVDIDS